MARKVTRAEYHKARRQRSVDVSQTSWTKRDKEKKTPGRLTGPKGKLYTGTVNLGEGKGLAVYKKGKRIGWRGKGLTGRKPATPPSSGSGGGGKDAASSSRTGFSSSAANRGGYSAAGYIKRLKPTSGGLPGSGKDNVNAATSGGSAKTSNYKNVTDSLMSTPVSTSWGAARPEPATANRPSKFRGKKTRLAKSGGQLRWVKVGK